MKTALRLFTVTLISVFLLAACGGSGGGGGTASYIIGVTVTGLEGSGLVLQNNAGDDLAISANGSFTFSTPVANGADYSVTVLTQPTGPNQTCTVNGTGTVSGADVMDVTVICSTEAYTIGGTVSGLLGAGLVLQNNGGDDLEITSGATSFTFATPVADTAGYAVTVLTQPSSPYQTCTVTGGAGTVSGADVTDVTVTCSGNAYAIGGTASGIAGSVVLQNNGGDDLMLTADGTFSFATPVANTVGYEVTIFSSIGHVCTLSSASGTVSGSNVANVALSCTPVSVSALYNTNGADWNDYVKNDGTDIYTALDTDCTGAETGGYSACLHGGEIRVVEVPGKSTCTGLTVSEVLGAFDWTCGDSTGTARFISTGLKDGKNLSDLLDFTTPAWEQNSVTVLDGGVEHFTTAPAAWWTNPVAVDNDGGYLNNAGTIYVVTASSDLPEGYIINASSVGLVGQPGVIINGPGAGAGSYVVSADGSVEARDFLWVEGSVDATGGEVGVFLKSVGFSVLRNVTAENTDIGDYVWVGICLAQSSNNTLSGITASNNHMGVRLAASSNNNTLYGITAANNNIGVDFWFSSNNTLSRVTASNNGTGVGLGFSSNNTITGVTAANNANNGVLLIGESSNNTLSGVTAANNANNGVWLYSSADNNTLSGVAASNNGERGVSLDSSSNNYFTGPLKVGNNGLGDCYVSGGTNPGLVGTTCTTSGDYGSGGTGGYGIGNISDAALYNSVTLAGSFVAKVVADDSVNASDTGSAVAYPADPSTFDWTNFENPFRGWGLDGAFGQADSRGRFFDECSNFYYSNQTDCEANEGTWNGAGRIWDWSLLATDTVIRGALTLPTGDDTLTHTWYSTTAANQTDCDVEFPGSLWNATDSVCETTLLRNAIEVQGDGLANENTLCESGETCLYMPNIGSYQGHGNLVDAGAFTDGDPATGITGVTLMKYETNGY